jgi:hypothetical protein
VDILLLIRLTLLILGSELGHHGKPADVEVSDILYWG